MTYHEPRRNEEAAAQPAGLHPDRAAGRDCDHRRAHRLASARCAGGSRGVSSYPMRQQPQADRAGPTQLRRGIRRLSAWSCRLRVDFEGRCFSTLTQILPQLEQNTTFNSINFNLNSDDENDVDLGGAPNATVRYNMVAAFLCPSDLSTRYGASCTDELPGEHRHDVPGMGLDASAPPRADIADQWAALAAELEESLAAILGKWSCGQTGLSWKSLPPTGDSIGSGCLSRGNGRADESTASLPAIRATTVGLGSWETCRQRHDGVRGTVAFIMYEAMRQLQEEGVLRVSLRAAAAPRHTDARRQCDGPALLFLVLGGSIRPMRPPAPITSKAWLRLASRAAIPGALPA